MDQTDLRHSVEYGNWVTMESLKYNNKASKYFGQPLRLFDEQGSCYVRILSDVGTMFPLHLEIG